MALQEIPPPLDDIAMDLDLGVVDPVVDTSDLTRFEHLTEGQRVRIIIRVICGLVALEEEEATTADRLAKRRRLPLLGLEWGGRRKLRSATEPPVSHLLPYLGGQRNF